MTYAIFPSQQEEKESVTTILNDRMNEQLAELRQVPKLYVESFTDERGYMGIRVTFDQSYLIGGGFLVFNRTAKTPMRNLASSLGGFAGTDVIIRGYAKNSGLSQGWARSLKNYFISDANVNAQRIATESYVGAPGRLEVTIRVGRRMIQDAQNGVID
jgi:hypothetical protein